MKGLHIASALLALLLLLALVGLVVAQNSPNYDLSWHVVATGGRDAASTNHALRGTLGQLAIGPAQSASAALGAGYWYRSGPGLSFFWLYLPLVVNDY